MRRLFLTVSGFWFYRVGLFFWMLVNGAPVGFDLATFRGPALTFVSFANTLIPLAVLELHLRAQRSGPSARLAMASVLVMLTVVATIGIFGATIGCGSDHPHGTVEAVGMRRARLLQIA